MTWKRYPQIIGDFPKPKYGFQQLLVNVGDYIETHGMSKEDVVKFIKAAEFWAWQHKRTIKTKQLKVPDGWRAVRVTLISLTRTRAYEVKKPRDK